MVNRPLAHKTLSLLLNAMQRIMPNAHIQSFRSDRGEDTPPGGWITSATLARTVKQGHVIMAAPSDDIEVPRVIIGLPLARPIFLAAALQVAGDYKEPARLIWRDADGWRYYAASPPTNFASGVPPGILINPDQALGVFRRMLAAIASDP